MGIQIVNESGLKGVLYSGESQYVMYQQSSFILYYVILNETLL